MQYFYSFHSQAFCSWRLRSWTFAMMRCWLQCIAIDRAKQQCRVWYSCHVENLNIPCRFTAFSSQNAHKQACKLSNLPIQRHQQIPVELDPAHRHEILRKKQTNNPRCNGQLIPLIELGGKPKWK